MADKPKILVTGASGFIGRRLVDRLLAEGYPLRCLSRRKVAAPAAGVENVIADLLDPDSLGYTLNGIDTAYYLVHSLDAGEKDFAAKDRAAAENFVAAADRAKLRRVIYLSGLGAHEELSDHLHSRHEVGEILRRGSFATTVLRAAVIIGAGGSSFEMLRFLVRTQPVIPDLPGLRTSCQPIAVDNVIGYLAGCLTVEATAGETFDIGGPEILSYREMLEHLAQVAGHVNLYFPTPVFSAWLTSRLIGLLSPVKSEVALALLKGLNNEVVCRENRIRELIPEPLIPYDRAVALALEEIQAGREARSSSTNFQGRP
jgi:uncharacterized protein YbjT (DUF2867 family)